MPSHDGTLWTEFQVARCNFVRAVVAIFATICCFVGGCCHIELGNYKLQLEVEDQPAAFRNADGINQEKLAVAVKLQNLSEYPIHLAENSIAGAHEACGLHMTVSIVDPTPPLSQLDHVDQGLRGGRTLRSLGDAHEPLLFDPYGHAVEELAEVGPPLLKLDPDLLRTALSLNGNEALLYAVIGVDWKAVSKDPFAQEFAVALKFNFYYVDCDGVRYNFSKTLEHRVQVHLINGRRYASTFLAVVGGPIEGRFERQAPATQP